MLLCFRLFCVWLIGDGYGLIQKEYGLIQKRCCLIQKYVVVYVIVF